MIEKRSSWSTPDGKHRFVDIAREASAAKKPFRLSFELTYRCNIDCVHCYCTDRTPNGELTTEEWIRTIDDAAEEGCMFLGLSGGEVFVRPDFLDIARHARKVGMAIRIKTNGVAINEARADAIAELHPLNVDISLLGATSEVHDELTRSKGSMRRALRGIALLKERGVNVWVRSSIMKDNVHQIKELKSLTKGMGCASSCSASIFPMNDGDQGPLDEMVDGEEFGDFIRKVAEYSPEILVPRDEEIKHTWLTCGAGHGGYVVNPFGDVHTCTALVMPLGNVRTDTWRQISRSRLLEKIRNITLEDLSECKTCEYNTHCNRCHAKAWLETGNMYGKSPSSCRQAKIIKQIAEEDPQTAKEIKEALDGSQQPVNLSQ